MGRCILSCQDLFDENITVLPSDGLGFVNFQFVPHLNNEYFPKINFENLKNASKNLQEIDGKKLYIVDDNGAISVNNEIVKIITEGKWYKI